MILKPYITQSSQSVSWVLVSDAFKLFSGGFTVAASNPKAVAFFTALTPQFLSLEGNGIGQLAGMVFVCLSAFVVAAFFGSLGACEPSQILDKCLGEISRAVRCAERSQDEPTVHTYRPQQ